MEGMTMTAPWDETRIARDNGGRFDGKVLHAAEISLGEDFDMSTFMMAPPETPEPFTAFQPVIYTDIDGNDIAAVVVKESEYPNWLILDTREPGTIGETDGDHFTAEARYVRPDDTVSRDAVRRQSAALSAVEAVCEEIAADGEDQPGLNLYTAALAVRDQLKVGGKTDATDTFNGARYAAEREFMRLAGSDLISRDVVALFEFDFDGTAAPEAIRNAYNAVGFDATSPLQAVAYAKALEPYRGWADELVLEDLAGAYDDARDLGRRVKASAKAAAGVDTTVNSMSVEEAEAVFGAAVTALPQRKAAAYTKARDLVENAFAALYAHGLLDMDQEDWARPDRHGVGPGARGDSPAADLVRGAGQAAILRHFEPETGITGKQLDAIDSVFASAVKASAKKAAA